MAAADQGLFKKSCYDISIQTAWQKFAGKSVLA
jgi:hypothetical protein